MPSPLRARLFRVLYGPAARTYDPFTTWLFLGEWARWQQAVLPLLPETGLIVELGAGTGALAVAGCGPGRGWIGIEPSPSMLRVAKRRLRPGGPWFVRATAESIPVATGRAGAVLATFPTPFVLAEATAREARRVLRPDGRIVVALSGELAPTGLRRRARRLALRLFYAGAPQTQAGPFALPGFAGTIERVATRHGTVDVYVGTPADNVAAGAQPGEPSQDRRL